MVTSAELSLSDLRRAYFGGGSDAEFAHLQELYDADITADDILSTVEEFNVFKASADIDYDTLLEIGAGLDAKLNVAAPVGTGDMTLTGDFTARFGGTTTKIGNVGPSSEPGIKFSTDTTFYRSAANSMTLATYLKVNSTIEAATAGAAKVTIGDVGTGAKAGIAFGSASDTSIYRDASGIVKTDGAFRSGGNSVAQVDVAARTDMGAVGPSSESGIRFGSAADTNLYRVGANALATDDVFSAATGSAANEIRLGANGIQFGSAWDTNLYRSAANTLSTDDDFLASRLSANKVNAGSVGLSTAATLMAQALNNGDDTARLYAKTGQTGVILNLVDSGATPLVQVTTAGVVQLIASAARIKFGHADQEQTTVGALGAADALPETPTKYFKVVDSAGTTLVIPAYAAA